MVTTTNEQKRKHRKIRIRPRCGASRRKWAAHDPCFVPVDGTRITVRRLPLIDAMRINRKCPECWSAWDSRGAPLIGPDQQSLVLLGVSRASTNGRSKRSGPPLHLGAMKLLGLNAVIARVADDLRRVR